MKQRSLVIAAAAPAAAIFVFGVIYGSLVRPLMGVAAAVASSLFIFSGAVQFTLAGLLSAGAGVGALIGGAVSLNLRNLLLGAVMRPRLDRPSMERAGLAWFLTDESVGLALASGANAARTLLSSGAIFYLAWQAGTIVGVFGASVEGVRSAAEAVFPVLFIGLAALSCPSRSIAIRAIVAAGLTAAAVTPWPATRGVAPVIVAIAVALPGAQK
jgi:predicted branched-subunit amino acid permease